MKVIAKIVSVFLGAVTIHDVVILQSGLINSTYKVATSKGDFILQKMNQTVFPNIHALLNNKIKITQYFQKIGFPTITFLSTSEGLCYTQEGEDTWQLSVYVPSVVKEKIESPRMAEKAGIYLAQFHKALLDFPITELEYTLPDFHNTPKRYTYFKEKLVTASKERLLNATKEIEQLEYYYDTIASVALAIQKGEIPLRVVHNDTKIGNMLFDEKDNIICIIDYDTIMPGSILHDVGDALRTGANTASEEEKDLSKVNFDAKIYESFMKGYTDEALSFMTANEAQAIHLSLPLLLFEQACRFLSDYLDNDSYYATTYEEHNLVRAKTQIHLLTQVCGYFNL
ncbi:phosphotransferase enzyme family protein [Flavobacterium sp. RSSA_27]|uniref:phosphotransferase enzyme family protein n=1 Tax=Flavobacterium sp. RSSA_27 TaxID=3447667 RepID=UPI003F36B704